MFKKFLKQLVGLVKNPSAPSQAFRPALTLMVIFSGTIALLDYRDSLKHGHSTLQLSLAMVFLGLWFLFSERHLKPNKNIPLRTSFFLDEIFFLGPQAFIIYITDGVNSPLAFIFYILAVVSVTLYYPRYLSFINIASVCSINLFFHLNATLDSNNLQNLFVETSILVYIGTTLTELIEEVGKRGKNLLHNSQLKNQTLFENSPMPVKILEPDGRLRYANPFSLKLGKNFSPQSFDYINNVDPEYRDLFKKNLDLAMEGKSSQSEIRRAAGAGSCEWTTETFIPVKNEEDKITEIIVLSLDITEKKKMLEQNKKIHDLKNSFITTVSHQMRTPVSAVRWNLEMLLGGQAGNISSAQKEIIQNSYSATREIISRLNDLLVVLEVESGHVDLMKKDIRLSEIINTLWPSFIEQCKLKKIKYSLENKVSDPPAVKADPGKTSYALQKILDNALAYTKVGGKISAAISDTGEKIRFEVNDTGIGIPEKEQDKIFNVFFRASNAAQMLPDASGLGLYLAKHFIELEGGRIGFQSAEEKGSTFWVEFPTSKS